LNIGGKGVQLHLSYGIKGPLIPKNDLLTVTITLRSKTASEMSLNYA